MEHDGIVMVLADDDGAMMAATGWALGKQGRTEKNSVAGLFDWIENTFRSAGATLVYFAVVRGTHGSDPHRVL